MQEVFLLKMAAVGPVAAGLAYLLEKLTPAKRRGIAAGAAILALLWLAPRAGAQTAGAAPTYLHATYYKVPSSQVAAFLEIEQGVMKKIAEGRVASGEKRAWALFSVVGAGTSGEYNYLVIYSSDHAPDIATGDKWRAWLKATGSSMDMGAITNFLQPLIVRSVIWRTIARAGGGLQPGYAASVRRYRIASGKSNTVFTHHREITLPVMSELIQQGKLQGFGVSSPVFSGSSTPDFDYTVSSVFKTPQEAIEGIGMDVYRSAFTKVHAGKSMDEVLKPLIENRTSVRGELWRVVDRVASR